VLTPENRIPASINPKKEVIPLLYTVQIGSYSTQTEAEQITQDLQSKGFKTSFVPANVNGQTWYRVNVGLFGTVKEAQEYKKEFLIKTKLTSAIVQRVLQ
jgi:cell division protein FtsN